MEVLIVSPFLPYKLVPHAGGIYLYELVKYLSQRHNIHFITRVETSEEPYRDEIKKYCKNVHYLKYKKTGKTGIAGMVSIMLSYARLSLFANKIVKANRFDVVLAQYLETGLFLKPVKNIKFIVDMHDVISKPYERIYKGSKGISKFLNFFIWKASIFVEKYVAEKFDIIFTRSEIDKKIVLEYNPGLDIKICPHPAGLDLLDASPTSEVKEKEPYSILYLGAMNRDANIKSVLYFYNFVYPILKIEFPDLKWYIVGNAPPPEITQLAADKQITVTGFVNDPSGYYQKSCVFISPIVIGGGIIAKNLNAMAAGIPLVTSPYGNEGIGAEHNKEAFIAQTPEEFAKYISILFKNEKLREEITINAKKFVAENYSIEACMSKIERAF